MSESLGDLQCVSQRLFELQRTIAVHLVAQVRAFNEFEDNEVPTVVLTDVIDAGDVRMVEASSVLRLVLEAADGLLIRVVPREHLDGNGAAQPRVGRSKDSAHASAAYERAELVVLKPFTDERAPQELRQGRVEESITRDERALGNDGILVGTQCRWAASRSILVATTGFRVQGTRRLVHWGVVAGCVS